MDEPTEKKLREYIDRVGATQVGVPVTTDEVFFDYLPQPDNPLQEQAGTAKGTEDRSPYALTRQDIWLQTSNGNWVCRTPQKEDMTFRTHLSVPHEKRVPLYRTIHGEHPIRIELNLQQDLLDKENIKTLAQSLEELGVGPIAQLKTQKERFVLPNEFVLELIKTDSGFSSGNLSIYVSQTKEADLKRVGNTISTLIEEIGIEHVPYCPTPALEYIYRNNPDHYRMLVRAGVAPERKEETKKPQPEKSKSE